MTIAVVARERRGEDFWVNDTHAVGGSYRGEGRPFAFGSQSIADEEFVYFDPPLPPLLQAAFGYVPEERVSLIAMCNEDPDHRILAELILHIASPLGGIIDFGGVAAPNELLDDSVVSAAYKAAGGQICYAQFAGPAFLRRWFAHPRFRMVK